MKLILYNTKSTSANTTYVTMEEEDYNFISGAIVSLLTYMTELSLTSDTDIRKMTKWFTKSDKIYLYNRKMKRSNSPQSFLAGVLNNTLFGNQEDFSLIQLQTLENIFSKAINLVDEIESRGVVLQEKKRFEDIFIREKLWEIER